MIHVKQAVQIAKAHAVDMLGQSNLTLEEVDRDEFRGRDVWIITLGYPLDLSRLPDLNRIAAEPVQYKRFFIDAQTGEMLAMLLREHAHS